PSQRSCVSQIVPRTVATANRPAVLKLPFDEPQSWRIGLLLAAAAERGDVHAEKSPPVSVMVVGAEGSAGCVIVNAAGTSPSAVTTFRELACRGTGCCKSEKVPNRPSEPVSVISPFDASIVSPEWITITLSDVTATPLMSTVPVAIAL